MPFDPSAISTPFRMQPGLRRVAPGTARLTANRLDSAVLAAKLAVLRDHPDQALCAVPGCDAGPVVDALVRQARRDPPPALQRHPDGGLEAPWLGWCVRGPRVEGDGPAAIGDCLRALPRHWRDAALLCLAFAEDFALLDGETTTIPWLAVCLPSHWAPEVKIGRPFAEVHAPVADNQLLLKAAESLARLVSRDQAWERFVWTLTPSARLDGHPQRHPAPAWSPHAEAEAIARQAWLRTEHQHFIPLPERRQAVFTIQVELRPLTEVAPHWGHALHAALASMSPAVLAYRGLGPARDRLLDWLARHGGPAP